MKNTKKAYLISTAHTIADCVSTKDEINEITAYMGSDQILFVDAYVGLLPVRAAVLDKQYGEKVSAVNNEGKVTNRGPLLLFGRDKRGKTVSLSEKELDYLDDSVEIRSFRSGKDIMPPSYLSYVMVGYAHTVNISLWRGDNCV